MFISKLAGLLLLGVYFLPSPSFAQQPIEKNRYQVVGYDSQKVPFFIDTKQLGSLKVFSITQIKNDQISQLVFQPSCLERKLVYLTYASFSTSGKLLNQTVKNQPIDLKPNTVAYIGMTKYCQAIKATGW
jgi:hypothetical protein